MCREHPLAGPPQQQRVGRRQQPERPTHWRCGYGRLARGRGGRRGDWRRLAPRSTAAHRWTPPRLPLSVRLPAAAEATPGGWSGRRGERASDPCCSRDAAGGGGCGRAVTLLAARAFAPSAAAKDVRWSCKGARTENPLARPRFSGCSPCLGAFAPGAAAAGSWLPPLRTQRCGVHVAIAFAAQPHRQDGAARAGHAAGGRAE